LSKSCAGTAEKRPAPNIVHGTTPIAAIRNEAISPSVFDYAYHVDLDVLDSPSPLLQQTGKGGINSRILLKSFGA
jgi:hypothetical protein